MNLKLLNFKVGVSSKFWGGVERSGGGGEVVDGILGGLGAP